MKSVREARILDILTRKDMSTSELCVLVHCTQRSAQELLAKLKGLMRQSHHGQQIRSDRNENAPRKLKRIKNFAWRGKRLRR